MMQEAISCGFHISSLFHRSSPNRSAEGKAEPFTRALKPKKG